MAAAVERFLVRFPKQNTKLLRWLELCKEQERGYLSDILTLLLHTFFSTKEILHIATVDSSLCSCKKEWTTTISIRSSTDPSFIENINYLRSRREFNSFLMGLLNRAIDDGKTEELASTWDLHVMNLPMYKAETAGTESSINALQTPQLQLVKVNSRKVENKRSVADTDTKASDQATKAASEKSVLVQKKSSTNAVSAKNTAKEEEKTPQAKLSLSKKSVQALDGWLQ